MMTDNTVDANPRRHQVNWKLIDWTTVKRTVRRLQERIVKAFKQNDLRKVKDLQRLLSKSYHARLLAVNRVTTNKGWKTPGIDKVIWKTAQQKLKAVDQLLEPIPQAPLRRIYIPKKNGKKRPLGIPTMSIRGQQALHALTLEPIAETTADPSSFGFRPVRGCRDAMKRLFSLLCRSSSPQWILEGDIKSCFDEISHTWILENIPMDKKVVQGWLTAGYSEEGKLFPTDSGTPQGGLASPIIANMVLDGLESKLHEKFGKAGSAKLKKHKVHFVRYADDFVITGTDENLLKETVLPIVQEHLKARGLRLSEEKTVITHVSKGFDFLGQNVRKYKRTLLIRPSAKSITAIKEKIADTIKQYRERPHVMLTRLNSIIRGWANFHKHAVSKRAFGDVDHYVFQKLWKWACRRHPNKGLKWIKAKYFTHEGKRKWVFRIKHPENPVTRFLASSVLIQWHSMVKLHANPYDPEWKSYFSLRHSRILARKQPYLLETAWQRQNHCCALCNQLITQASEGVIYFPHDNIALDKTTPLLHARLIHLDCLESTKAGSSDEGLINA
ncbi:MAG: group II intron reverse transcriptase/maturase [Verrucomicrobia bacterium]|nr:group II intron reverse transcriptase/maturase [Verrucomicrobiota bacterium]